MNIAALTAEQVMSRVLVTVDCTESPLMAWEFMRRAGVHHLPVLDRGSRLVGILTRQQVAAHWSGGPEELSRRKVGDLVARKRVQKVQPELPLPKVAEAVLDSECDAVAVIGPEGVLIGLVTATDVLAAVAGRIAPAAETGEVMSGMFHLEPVVPFGTAG